MTYKPDIVIYHSPCDDGFGAALAAWMRWGDDVQFLPGTYGKPAPDVAGKHVLIGDFSFKKPVLEEMARSAASVVILDHHKTAQEDLNGYPDPAFASEAYHIGLDGMLPVWARFDMNKSGARMMWEFCHPGEAAPLLIQLIEDRDLWRFALPETRAFSLWLRSHSYDFRAWDVLRIRLEDETERATIMTQAHAIQGFYDQKIAEMIREARPVTIGGFDVPAVNCSWAFASDVAHALLLGQPDAPFAVCYYDRGDGRRSYSLRSEDDRADVSVIARAMGGGGHRNAAGFETAIPLVSGA